MLFYLIRFNNYRCFNSIGPIGLKPSEYFNIITSPEQPQMLLRYEVCSGHRKAEELCFGVWSVDLANSLRKANASGFYTHPVEVTKSGQPIDGYLGVRITGKGGPIDRLRSGAPLTGTPIIYHKAIYMDIHRWDGSDVFLLPDMGGNVFVTERAAQAIQKTKMRALRLIPNDQCSLP